MPKQTDCFICGEKKLRHDVIALNKKLLGRKIDNFHCMQCLANYLDISAEDLENNIQQFKDSGCDLFV